MEVVMCPTTKPAGVLQDLPIRVPLVRGASASTAAAPIFVRRVVGASAIGAAAILVRRLYVASSSSLLKETGADLTD